jgi:hypothetical protein
MQLYGTRSLDSGAFLRADYAVRVAACCVQHLYINRMSQRGIVLSSCLPSCTQIRTRDMAFKHVASYQRYAYGASRGVFTSRQLQA